VGKNICQLHIRQRIDNRIYRELKNLNSPKINEPIKKWATELRRKLSTKEIQMALKKCSPSLAIKEMQIKTTLRFHLTPVRIAIIKITTNNLCCKDVGKKEPLYTAGGNASWCNHSRKKFGVFLKI
jgi:ribonuclease I